MRIPIYSDTESFIKLKKQHLYEKLQQQEDEGTAVHNNFKVQAKEKKGDIYENMSIESFKQKYISQIPHLEEIWTGLSGIEGVSMFVKKEGLTNYGQVLASACKNIATCYNNFYIENFENIISNYFTYMIRAEFQDLRMPYIKNIILFNVQLSTFPENIGSSVNKETQDKIRKYLNPLIVEIKNRLPPAPISKATLNKAPFHIMPVFRHILSKYESIIEADQEVTTSIQLPLTLPQQSDLLQQTEDSNQSRKRPKKKKSSIKNKISNAHKDKEKRFQPPRLFSLFPNPSLKWRIRQVQEETPFSFTQRSFFECFNFRKFKISSEEIKQYFRPCTVDPNRKDVFTSYHGKNDVRRLSSSEYYNMNGVINRQKQELERKKSNNIEYIETRIPSPKTTGAENYKRHITYMLQHFEALVTFYDFQTARIRWSNYIGKQKATDLAINILINDSTKYNKNRRKNTRRNKHIKLQQLQYLLEPRRLSIEEYVQTIAISIWRGNGSPSVFQRQSATSNVVAAPSSVTA
ncbi:uncharacterized protein EV154DRAFT_579526 [Mucor mucedo]|uniref:uncharacterized protein n=1 Tax=Mucor mucedo TaxID=29922 RepID=UPI00221F9D23|nr:uncharacterized protein EV154DRAFT_579526 [Mucor mucedo]KAI7873102.1 hypothetical protein EV154DRAFT_579526 [Mucor mucedo]